jgi:HK97 family phage portal protein
MTAFEYRELIQSHLALYGNGYSIIEMNGSGQVIELFPLRPDKMQQIAQQPNGRWAYLYQFPNGRTEWFDQSKIWHLRGLGSDGRIGYSPIQLMRQSIGLGQAAESFGARFFGNDARPGMVLETPGTLSDEALEHLRDSWDSEHSGVDKSHKTAILEEGLKASTIGIPPEDAQFLETRKFQTQEIARAYRIPPHMLADLDKATFSNIEHQGIEFVQHTMQPWFKRWEQSIQKWLMLERDRSTFFSEYLIDGLLRGDSKTRAEFYSMARQWGWLSANDIRELENQNPVEGGDAYLVPLNMIPAEDLDDVTVQASANGSRAESRSGRSLRGRRRLISSFQSVFEDAIARVVRREVIDIGREAKKQLRRRTIPELSLWLNQFYDEHREFIRRHMRPVFRSYAEAIAGEAAKEIEGDPIADEELEELVDAYVDDFAAHHIGISAGSIKNLLQRSLEEGFEALPALEELLGEWEESRAEHIANIETVRSNNAFAVGAFVAGGVTVLKWRAFGENCPYCNKLNGRTVGVQEAFLPADADFEPDGADRPLRPKFDVRHPPAHDGCDCMVIAA